MDADSEPFQMKLVKGVALCFHNMFLKALRLHSDRLQLQQGQSEELVSRGLLDM